MADSASAHETRPEKVALTLELDAEVYEAFLRKAERAGMAIEPFLNNTLGIVLGCRVFNEQHACTPEAHDAAARKLIRPVQFKP